MSGYTKKCTYCNQEIRLSNDSGSWKPYELNTNEIHDCRNKQQTQSQQAQPQNKKQLTLEDLDLRLKVLEAKISEVFGTN